MANALKSCRHLLAGLFVLPVALILSGGAPTKTVTIVAKVPPFTSPQETIYVTGNAPELCDWETKCLPMRRIDVGTYSVQLTVPSWYSTLQYKITRGTWDTEAAGPSGQRFDNTDIYLNQADNLSVVNIPNWKDAAPLGITGRRIIHPDFYSPQLNNKRAVRVWLPADYASNPKKRYPVIYMHDGQNLFDPDLSYTGVDWMVDEWMTRMIASGTVPAAIIVGPDCTGDRMAEYNYVSRGRLYAEFLTQTLKPFIDANYRTLPGRETTYTMGSSMGGLISVALLWYHSDVFSKAAAVSLPVWIEYNAIYKFAVRETMPKLPVKLYIDWGDFGGDIGYPAPGDRFLKYLDEIGFPRDQWYFRLYKYADHSEVDWARRADIPLRYLLTGGLTSH